MRDALLYCHEVVVFAFLDVAGAFLEVLLAPFVHDGDGVDELAVGCWDEWLFHIKTRPLPLPYEGGE